MYLVQFLNTVRNGFSSIIINLKKNVSFTFTLFLLQ